MVRYLADNDCIYTQFIDASLVTMDGVGCHLNFYVLVILLRVQATAGSHCGSTQFLEDIHHG